MVSWLFIVQEFRSSEVQEFRSSEVIDGETYKYE
jgi:hypothetical protein